MMDPNGCVIAFHERRDRTQWPSSPAQLSMNASKQVRRIMLVAAVFAALPRPTTAASQCVGYGAASLAGTLVRQTYPGPPDYESVTKGDEPRVIWVLLLDERACMYSDSTYTSRYGEREVQLALDPDQYTQYRQFLNKQLIVTGVLVRGGVRDEKRLVLIVNEMRKAPAIRSDAHEYGYSPDCPC
jgi:hypothetical protein